MKHIQHLFLFCFIALMAISCKDKTETTHLYSEFENGRKYIYDYVPVISISGSWKQMGRQYGHFLSGNILEVYNTVAPYKDRYNLGSGRNNAELIEELYQSYSSTYKDFFEGMSETSGLTLDQLKTANSLEIVLMLGTGIYPTRCSSIAAWNDYTTTGKVLFGRNYDYNSEFISLNKDIVVTVFHPDNGEIPFAICTWAGCIYASTGINQKGIFAEENDCSPHDKQAAGFYVTGDHLNLKVWVKDDARLLSMLGSCRTLDEADTWMKNNLPCYPHGIGIADKNEGRVYQWDIPDRVPHAPFARQEKGLMVQTNHYFTVPEGWNLAPYEEADSSGSAIPGGSIPRLQHLLQLARHDKGSINLARMCEIMDMKYENGGATVDGTLYQIVCEPGTLTFKLKTKAKQDRWVNIPLSELLKGF
ncbi:MAG: C45 family peptidase [Bacteroidota bacterium]|nr:C45 family peptidase [Bacteroidota bacterium]